MVARSCGQVLGAAGFLLACAPTALGAEDDKLLGSGILDIVEIGGPVMIIILAGSVIGLAFAFDRFFALRRSRLVPKALVTSVREAAARGDVEAITAAVADRAGSLARILRAGLARRAAGVAEMERVMETVGGAEVARLKRPVRPLSVLATIEPLLGLLGTILGMINTFNMLQTTSAAERVAKLAPGIGEALYTTAAGLCVAIPFVVLYHYLCGRVNRAAEEWDLVGSDVILAVTGPVTQTATAKPRAVPATPADDGRAATGAATA